MGLRPEGGKVLNEAQSMLLRISRGTGCPRQKSLNTGSGDEKSMRRDSKQQILSRGDAPLKGSQRKKRQKGTL